MIVDKSRCSNLLGCLILASLMVTLPQAAEPSLAQESAETYVIGPTDVLSVTFWQQPDLNRTVRVSENGMISLPVIGEMKAAGFTTAQLSKKIIEQMSFYNTPVSQASVVVTEFNSRSIVVGGQVVTPQTLHLEKIPDLWRVILAAGGPTELADLSRVTVVRKVGTKSEVIDVDLYKIIKDGDFSKAPQLQAGDLVNVPSSPYGISAPIPAGAEAVSQGKNIFYIFGQVTAQGPKNLEAGIDVLDAIAIAGGTTIDADLGNVRVVVKNTSYSSVAKIDLNKYMRSGNPPRLLIHPEDTIIVPAKGAHPFTTVLSTIGSIMPVITAVGTLILLSRR